jgi:hypothetical protein
MKQTYPDNRGNQSVGGNKLQLLCSATECGTRQHFYRSIILAVSGSLLCVAAGENAAAQSINAAPQTPGPMLGESAESSSPASFNALHSMEATQWPLQYLEPAGGTLICYDAGNSPLWHPGEQLELFNWHRSPQNANGPTLMDIAPDTGTAPAANPPAPAVSATPSAANPPAVSAAPGAPPTTTTDTDANSNPNLALPEMPIQQPTVRQNEVSGSADFMYGTGTITVPVGYAFNGVQRAALTANRSTVYYGGTLSYSYGRSWYIDFSGEDGRSTGSTSLQIPGLAGPSIPASFDVNDTWYQVYLRYNLKNFLAGTRFTAYLRGGVSLVSATLDTVNDSFSSFGPGGFYTEHDKTFDVLGQFGFGLTYSLYSTPRLKVGLQLEGEGFGGNRTQDITETFVPHNQPLSATINNTVYGALGRLTLHADYRLGESGRWKLTGDVGVMTKNSWVSYPDFGTRPETLYGPYVKAGASFVF